MNKQFYINCANCPNLIRTIIQKDGIFYRYGCKSNGYTTGWLRCDFDLTHMACSVGHELIMLKKKSKKEGEK